MLVFTQFLNAIENIAADIESPGVVLKLKKDTPLIHFIATDPSIKLYIRKAEGYRILVPDYMVPPVKKRLAELGYFNEK